RTASDLGVIVVCPDTSPRGEGVPDSPDYDLGQGASFYLNAIQEPWRKHFQMERYICEELIELVTTNFPVRPGAFGLTGHSMGGHGALTLALRHPEVFASVSAISPIVAPTACPWGHKAFTAYLGDDREAWVEHDACALLRARAKPLVDNILIDQGTDDPFLTRELMPERLAAVCQAVGQPLRLNMRPGYDHSYYFVATVIAEHLRHHAAALFELPAG
ncbi:MAG: S-formylglutathione hydrolase, partial [Nannocystaceae bacterium]